MIPEHGLPPTFDGRLLHYAVFIREGGLQPRPKALDGFRLFVLCKVFNTGLCKARRIVGRINDGHSVALGFYLREHCELIFEMIARCCLEPPCPEVMDGVMDVYYREFQVVPIYA